MATAQRVSTAKRSTATKKRTTPVKTKATSSARSATSVKNAKAVKAIGTRQTKTQIIADIAEEAGLDKKQVGAVFAALGRKIEAHIKPRGSGEITLPDTGVKVRRVTKPRTKARMGINPRTGEQIKIAAKPARKAVKLSALKSLKTLI